MPIVVLLVVVATIGAAVVVLAGRRGGDVLFEPDRPNFVLPDRDLTKHDIDGVRFAVGVRGYRMDQVDLVVDRLAAELAARDALIADLHGGADVPADERADEVTQADANGESEIEETEGAESVDTGVASGSDGDRG